MTALPLRSHGGVWLVVGVVQMSTVASFTCLLACIDGWKTGLSWTPLSPLQRVTVLPQASCTVSSALLHTADGFLLRELLKLSKQTLKYPLVS